MTTEDEYRDLVPLGNDGGLANEGGSMLAGVEAATGRAWALKVLPDRLDRRTRIEVEGELRRLAPLTERAPIVVADRIVDLPDGRRALRRELLAQSLPELVAGFGPLSVADALALAEALGEALGEALSVAGVVHGGVTPGNVLFRPSGEPVLTDFGVALRKAFPGDGDPSFRAPETIRDGVVDERSDRYGLGAVLYLALSGKSPFPRRPGEPEGDHILRVLTDPPPPIDRDDLPPGLSALVTELLAKDPAQRPADPAARLARPEAPPAMPLGEPILEFGPERARRRLSPPVLAGVAIAALVAVVAVLLVLSRPQDMDVPPMTPPVAGPSGSGVATPSPSSEAVRLELADPVDRGTVVELTWTSSADLTFAVVIAQPGQEPTYAYVENATKYSAPVDPASPYCFEIRGTNGASRYISPAKAIRGAVCGQ